MLRALDVFDEADDPPPMPNASSQKCNAVYEIPKENRCSFVKAECSEYNLGFISYLQLYYCSFSFLNSFAFIPLIFSLCVLFLSLGLTASEYLCPNLYTISKFLKLSDNLAGLTLLALGNGAPDVLSTYTAMDFDSSDLAISELVGAAFFITTIVVGSMGIIHPFKVPQVPFLRDVSFFIVILLIVGYAIVFVEELTLFHCVVLVGMYIVYVIVVVSSHSITTYRTRKRKREQRSRGNFTARYQQSRAPSFSGAVSALPDEEEAVGDGLEDDVDAENDDDQDADAIYMDDLDHLPTIEELLSSSVPINNSHRTGGGGGGAQDSILSLPTTATYGLSRLLKSLQRHSSHRIQLPGEDYIRSVSAPVPGSPKLDSAERGLSTEGNDGVVPPTAELVDREVDYDVDDDASPYRYNNTVPNSSINYQTQLLTTLFFPNYLGFGELPVSAKVTTVLLTPILFLLRVSVPVRDQSCIEMLEGRKRESLNVHLGIGENFDGADDETSADSEEPPFNYEVDKLLLPVQAFFSVLFIAHTWLNEYPNFFTVTFPVSLLLGAGLAFLTHTFYSNLDSSAVRVMYHAAAFLGFVSAISWISVFATEIISILKMVSLVYNISDEILGVTIFALGNSVGDFISNFTIAKMGMPLMAFGACFGGPLLTFSSMGLSGLLIYPGLKNKEHLLQSGFPLGNSQTLTTTFFGLFINSIFLFVAVPRNEWMVDKKIGVVSMVIWFLTTAFCVASELSAAP